MLEAPRTPHAEETLKLVTIGRRTGLPHVVELRFVPRNKSFLVVGGGPRSDWVQNALGRSLNVRIGGLSYDCIVKSVIASEWDRVLEDFTRKYGSRVVKQWYSNPETVLELVPVSPPTVRGAARGELEPVNSFAEWKEKNGPHYYESVRAAFDSAADEYDYTISHNFINSWIRKRSIETLLPFSSPNDVLVEIGCGTGAEAIEIAPHVKRIVATDISARMLEILEKKIRVRGLAEKISLARSRASEISSVRDLLPSGRVRVAYSFNGALNCEPKIASFPAELAEIIEPGGYFVCSVRNTICFSETLAHLLALQYGKAFPRKKQPTMVSVGGRDIPAYYASPNDFGKIFRPHFELVKAYGLPAILPPAYLNRHYMKLRSITSSIFEKLDAALAPLFPFNTLGDQSLLVFERRAD